MEQAINAAVEYLHRKNRVTHPSGKFDNASRWYPDDYEKQECCSNIRSPSRSFPYTYMTHCRSLPHVCNYFGVNKKDVRYVLSKKGVALLIGIEDKVVQTYVERKLK